jgi:antitoxin (DNA-binding transcriptional repressor) of toxin-antitoxin stability system
MNVAMAEAAARLPELVRLMERGEEVILTDAGEPVARIAPPPQKRKVRFGGMKDRIKLKPGWDDPIDEDRFPAGEL